MRSWTRLSLIWATVVASLLLATPRAFAQDRVLIRNTAPVFGANRSVYWSPGEWQVSLSSRNLVSNNHYNGTVEQVQRQTLQNYVTNRQNLLDISISRAMTKRLALTAAIPYINSSWASRDPLQPLPAPRHEIAQNGRGLGDITVGARYWILNPDTHLKFIFPLAAE